MGGNPNDDCRSTSSSCIGKRDEARNKNALNNTKDRPAASATAADTTSTSKQSAAASTRRLTDRGGPKLIYECVDITKNLPYENEFFDLVINKATMDSILCTHGALNNVKQMMRECSRVLNNKHGSMIVVSHGKPYDRLVYFENDEKWWNGGVRVYKVDQPKNTTRAHPIAAGSGCSHHYVYIAAK